MIPKERSKLYLKLAPKFYIGLSLALQLCRKSRRLLSVCVTPLFQRLLPARYRAACARACQPISGHLRRLISLPHRCALCDSRTPQRICAPCQQQFFYSPHYPCTVCALPLAYSALLCGGCLKKMPAFDRVHSPYLYQAPLSNLIFQFKEQHDFFVGRALADIWCNSIKQHMTQQHTPLPDMITAVPLHWRKQGQRGFNQSAFFAHIIHQKLNIPLFKDVKRTESAPEQKNLDRQQRLTNLKHSFTVTRSLSNVHVVIIDDVMTTGATVNALTIALKKAGAAKVSVWVLARVPK